MNWFAQKTIKRVGSFLLDWLGWWLLVVAMVNIPSEAYRYCMGDFDPYRGIWISIVAGLSLVIWWKIIHRRKEVGNAK